MPVKSNEAAHINRINEEVCKEVRTLPRLPFTIQTQELFDEFIAVADVIVAHNAEFDKSWLSGEWNSKPWVCTQNDLKWPNNDKEGSSLIYTALNHGVPVVKVHRAMADCELIMEAFNRVSDIEERLVEAMSEETATFKAIVDFAQKEDAKEAGFKWNKDTKTWSRRMRVSEAKLLPFKVEMLG